jgi:hypothetical protein
MLHGYTVPACIECDAAIPAEVMDYAPDADIDFAVEEPAIYCAGCRDFVCGSCVGTTHPATSRACEDEGELQRAVAANQEALIVRLDFAG